MELLQLSIIFNKLVLTSELKNIYIYILVSHLLCTYQGRPLTIFVYVFQFSVQFKTFFPVFQYSVRQIAFSEFQFLIHAFFLKVEKSKFTTQNTENFKMSFEIILTM